MSFRECSHDHVFGGASPAAERGTRVVMWITLAMMLVEISAGWWFNSMALLADGWHMSSHALAIGLSAFAYAAARKYARDPRFAFGTWKIEILAGFASAICLLGVALLMFASSVERLLAPQPIQYREAVLVAVIGLVVNLVCARILGHAHERHEHHHDAHHEHHEHRHGAAGQPDHHHHDLNLRSAYLHVIADAATSGLAIFALLGGWFYGWFWLDPLMGIVGAFLVGRWSKGLLVDTGKVLLDREMDHPLVGEIRQLLAVVPGQLELTDLHVWRVGQAAYACALCVATDDPALTPAVLRERLAIHAELVHSTIEVDYRSAAAR